MKILMLGWELPPHNSGGLGVACLHLSRALASRGAEIDFVVPYSATHEHVGHMNVLSALPIHHDKKYGHTGAYESSNYSDTSALRATQQRYVDYIDEYVRNHHDFDVIHAHDWLTMEAGVRAKQLTNIPLVVHVHATEFDRGGERGGNPIVHEIEQQALLAADKIYAVSDYTKRIIVHRYHIPAEKVDVLHNAIDPSTLSSPDDYDGRTYRYLESLKANNIKIVTTMTRFTVQKGLMHLMKAAARVCRETDDVVFLFAGDGEQKHELIDLAAHYGISHRVIFTGFVRGKQWRDAYGVSDIFVMSSVSEPFGLTALEAAHYGNALIITHQSGVGEVLQSIRRYDFWDTRALADHIIELSSQPDTLRKLRSGVQHEYAAVSWDMIADRCLSWYPIQKEALV
jgi:glycogen(starch) synthase